MHRFMTWLLVLGLVATPALASSPANGADSAATTTVSPAELQEMKALLKAQAEALQEQRAAVQRAEQKIHELEQRLGVTPAVEPAVLTAASPAMAVEPKAGAAEERAPLYFKIGDAKFTPGGFLDFIGFFRGTNVGSGIATSFGTIPYNNTVAGHMSETRMSAQSSRLGLKVETNVGANKVLGYVETDFVGNSAANQYVTSNSMTMRLRMYLADVRRGKWELMGGQAWTLMTPSRRGLAVLPGDIFLPMIGDANYHVGLPWARQAQVRLMYHPTDNTVLALSVENPQQFVGSAETTFASAFNTQLGGQFDAANLSSTPNLHPDVIVKVAHDRKVGARNLHVEAGGIVRSFKATNQIATVGTSTVLTGPFASHTLTEGGITAAGNFELFKNFNVVSNAVWGAGTGRYLAGLAPDVVVRPVALTSTTYDVALSPVHSGSMMAGFEYQPVKTTTFAAYYGGMYAARNAFVDATSTASTKPYIGFGGPGSPNTANRAIQEATLAVTQTFWKNPNFGALQFISQGSYLTRSPWFVDLAHGGPKNAHVFMSTAGIRYILP
jgi:hypothetical protein